MKNLIEHQHSFFAAAERDIVREIKEKKRATFSRITTELKLNAEYSDKEKTNAIADEDTIPVGAERFRFLEVLSRANFNGEEASGIHDTSLQT